MPLDEIMPIEEAIEQGDLTRVRSLCLSDPTIYDKPISPNCTEQPLHYGVWQGQLGIVEFLLDQGAKVNARADQGRTPLHYAAQHGHPQIAGLLIAHGAQIDALDDFGFTPLFTASRGREPECPDVVKILEMNGARVDLNALICLGRTEQVLALMDQNANVVREAPFPGYLVEDMAILIQCQAWEECGIMDTAQDGMEKVVTRNFPILERLLKLGADPDGKFGTALFYAVQIPTVSVAQLLLEHGASIKKNQEKGHDLMKMARTKEMRALLQQFLH